MYFNTPTTIIVQYPQSHIRSIGVAFGDEFFDNLYDEVVGLDEVVVLFIY